MPKAQQSINFKEKLTAQVRSTLSKKDSSADDPIAFQYLYTENERVELETELFDPIGDKAHSPVAGIVHRYPDRALLKITDICAVHCRYCFRKEMINNDHGALTDHDLKNALAYIKNTPEIKEIILTGGDPFTLNNQYLQSVITSLESVPHLDIIRFHTRIPIVQPTRMNDAFLDILRNMKKALYIVVHANHAKEIDENVERALLGLSRTGAVLLSQSVLLKNVNDNADTLGALFKKLLANRVKPYYLHHPDLVKGTGHFQVSFKKGQTIMKQLRGRISGLAQPHYVVDIPGGYGKVPLVASSLSISPEGEYFLEDRNGFLHLYPLHKADATND